MTDNKVLIPSWALSGHCDATSSCDFPYYRVPQTTLVYDPFLTSVNFNSGDNDSQRGRPISRSSRLMGVGNRDDRDNYPNLGNTPSQNALAFNRDCNSAGFAAIREEDRLTSEYYWLGCTFFTTALTIMFVLLQILVMVGAVHLFAQGSSDHCSSILMGQLLSDVYGRQAISPTTTTRIAVPTAVAAVPAGVVVPPNNVPAVASGWLGLFAAPAAVSIPATVMAEQSAALDAEYDRELIQDISLGAAQNSIWNTLFAGSGAAVAAAATPLGGGDMAVLAQQLPPNEQYTTCSWLTNNVPCHNAWSVASTEMIERNPAAANMRYRDCDAKCSANVFDRYYKGPKPSNIPAQLTFGTGICTCS